MAAADRDQRSDGRTAADRRTVVMTADGKLRWHADALTGDRDDAFDAVPVAPAEVGEAVDPALVTNRVRIAQLRQERVGGAPDLGDMLLSRKGVSLGALAVALLAMAVVGSAARAGVLPPAFRWFDALPALGIFCPCLWSPLAVPLTGLGIAMARWSRVVARWAWTRRTVPSLAAAHRWSIAARLATSVGFAVMLFGAYWSAPPL